MILRHQIRNISAATRSGFDHASVLCRPRACAAPRRRFFYDMESERSFAPLTDDDLARLSEIALDVLRNKAFRTPVGRGYKDRLILLALCQGGKLNWVIIGAPGTIELPFHIAPSPRSCGASPLLRWGGPVSTVGRSF